MPVTTFPDKRESTMGISKRMIFMAAICLAVASSPSFADVAISSGTQLTADRTVDDTLYLSNGAMLDLNGYNLTMNSPAVSPDYVVRELLTIVR